MPVGLSLRRIGIMVVRLDNLPAVPARDGAASPLTPGGISGPLYGTKEFPVVGGRVGAMLFRAGGEPDRKAVAEIAEIDASWAPLHRTTGSSMVADNDSQEALGGAPWPA
jgi:hypothetical protein